MSIDRLISLGRIQCPARTIRACSPRRNPTSGYWLGGASRLHLRATEQYPPTTEQHDPEQRSIGDDHEHHTEQPPRHTSPVRQFRWQRGNGKAWNSVQGLSTKMDLGTGGEREDVVSGREWGWGIVAQRGGLCVRANSSGDSGGNFGTRAERNVVGLWDRMLRRWMRRREGVTKGGHTCYTVAELGNQSSLQNLLQRACCHDYYSDFPNYFDDPIIDTGSENCQDI
jgi:hypothetical protein